MTAAQKKLRELRARQSKERGKMAELAVAAELSDETRGELDAIETGTPDLERQLRAATTAVENEESEQRTAAKNGEGADLLDTEDRERDELRGKTRMGRYVQAAIEMRSVDGAEGEYNAAVEIGGNRFPLELLAPPERRVTAGPEDRAVTGVDIQTMPRSVARAIIRGRRPPWASRRNSNWKPKRNAVRLRRQLGGCGANHHGLESAVDTRIVRMSVRSKASTAAWAIGVTELKPKRNAVRLLFNLEDAARIPGLESALTRDLRMALVEGVDRAIFLGDSTATPNVGDVVGLNTATGITEEELTQAQKILWPATVSAFMKMIDGLHASAPADLRIVSSVGASRLWHSTTANANRNESVAQIMNGNGLNFMARANITETTGNNDFGAFIGRGRGINGAGVADVRSAGELIRDPYSGAAKGEVALTLCYLWDFQLPRASNFMRLKFVT